MTNGVSAHDWKVSRECINGSNLTLLSQLTYSLDVAPCDFFLSGAVKQDLKHYQGPMQREPLYNAERILGDFAGDALKSVLTNWMSGRQYVIDTDGSYLEPPTQQHSTICPNLLTAREYG
jgi:hypothetical protein